MDAAANLGLIQDPYGAYTTGDLVAELRVLPFDSQEWQRFWE